MEIHVDDMSELWRSDSIASTSTTVSDMEIKLATSSNSQTTCGRASSCIDSNALSVVGTNGLGTVSFTSDDAEINEIPSEVASSCNSPRACSTVKANGPNPTSFLSNNVKAKFTRSSSSKSDVSCGIEPNENVQYCVSKDTKLILDDFHFVQRLGSGDIGTVYLVELKGSRGCMFAAKVMDKEELAYRNKESRARIEKEILEMLDHPFLPSLYATLDCPRWSCLLTEFCPGGDLHVLRQRQPEKRFDEVAVRFFASEVVAALEYLHMLGVVYRDLKPENVLIRSDGHIMLTDFDLSLKCDNSISTAQLVYDHDIDSERFSISSCIMPSCVVPHVSCFRLGRRWKKRQRGYRQTLKIVAEPVEARSMSFVGTHEYLAPEIVSGEGHGNAVDWWTLGIFIYELFYGVTPFRGRDNEFTLANIVVRGLEFPKEPMVSSCAKDLISQLLHKDPTKRMGSMMGATAIKHHPFFEGVNWALLRCTKPPYVPSPKDFATSNHHHYDGNLDYY